MELDELHLISGNDIPFAEGRLIIHAPKIREIAMMTERSFNIGVQFLNFSKGYLSDKDKELLSEASDFDIIMSVMSSKENLPYKNDTLMIMYLLFPDYSFTFEDKKILFKKDELRGEINENNIEQFRSIVRKMFCLEKVQSINGVYDPADERAKKIAEKFKKRHEKLNSLKNKGNNEDVSVFSSYISILSVGLQMDMNKLLDYTVFQLINEFIRFQKKEEYDMYIRAKMAGCTDLEEVQNWMENIDM